MNYRHAYHAGNFADVLKHLTLMALLTSFERKSTPYCYVDTHGGRGFYDLASDAANKTQEFRLGIEKIIQADNPPPLVKHYLQLVHEINNALSHAHYASLKYYPGSPLFARKLLRPQDRLIACELQSDEYQALRETFAGDQQASIHHTDGFLGLKAFLPPKEKRGLVLIDPPYENPEEFTRLAHGLTTALKRFETGVYAIWYPIKDQPSVKRFYQAIEKLEKSALAIELTIYPDLPNHLNGNGMVIINPPWQFKEAMENNLPWIWKALTINNQGQYRVIPLK